MVQGQIITHSDTYSENFVFINFSYHIFIVPSCLSSTPSNVSPPPWSSFTLCNSAFHSFQFFFKFIKVEMIFYFSILIQCNAIHVKQLKHVTNSSYYVQLINFLTFLWKTWISSWIFWSDKIKQLTDQPWINIKLDILNHQLIYLI